LNSDKPYIEEFTVFIKVNIDNLKDFSKSIPLSVSKQLKNRRDIINIIIDKK
tara:strand:- start:340 stop:495 length:156 start_codon:yes stop_codon:yes gene_type:complete